MTERPRPRSSPPSEWWMRSVPALIGAHLALAVTLWGRPGSLGPYLWYLGPPVLALLAVVLLVIALASAIRRRTTWNRRRVVAYVGLALVAGAVLLYRTYPSSHDRRPSAVRFRLPLDGSVTVAWGGATAGVNYHVVQPDQRWAYDFLVTEHGRSHRGDGRALADYLAYDRPVRAPADGLVRVAHDGEPDMPPGKRSPKPALGNHVVLEVAPGEFLFVLHLREGSVAVAAGARVAAGQVIGRVGNSGTSTEPHVHVHLQDAPRPYFAEGIPFDFFGYRQEGRLVARGMPRGGIVRGRFLGDVVEQVVWHGNEPIR